MSGPADTPAPFPDKHDWAYGIVDGERKARDRSERISARDGDGDRDRDREHRDKDEGDRDRRGRGQSNGWRDSIRRSLSWNAGGRERQRHGGDRDKDRSGNRDGGRCRADDLQPEPGASSAAARPGREDARELEVLELHGEDGDLEATGPRGRRRVRSASPRASRRSSLAARTPPVTPDPPSSPTAVCPSSPSSKGSCQSLLLDTSPTYL
jgi:hypothetical protein